MKKKVASRKYKLSDSKLKQLADQILMLIERDITAFQDRGFTPEKKILFEKKRDAFANQPSDEQLEAIKIGITEDKNNARTKLEKSLRTVYLTAKLLFSENSGKTKEFGNSDISRQTDNELVRNAKIAEDACDKYTIELATEGWTKDKTDQLKQQRQELDDLIDEQVKAVSKRNLITEERIEAGNDLYELIIRYADIGKDIWYDSNEARYNDYVIYDEPDSTAMPADEPDAGTEEE